MSYTDYQYPPSGSSYDSYSQQYDTHSYSGSHHGQNKLPPSGGHYEYTSSQVSDQFSQPSDYNKYASTSFTKYTSTSVTAYSDPSSSYSPYQDGARTDQVASCSYGPHSSGTNTQQATENQSVSSYSSYQYHPSDYSQTSGSYEQANTSAGYEQDNNSYSYQDGPSPSLDTWSGNDQYSTYSSGYYEGSNSGSGYHEKEDPEYGNDVYSSSLDRYSEDSSGERGGDGYFQSNRCSAADSGSSSYQTYSKPHSVRVIKPQYDFQGYSGPAGLSQPAGNNKGTERSYSGERRAGFSVGSAGKSNYSGRGQGVGRGDFRGGYKRDNFTSRGRGSRFSGQDSLLSTQPAETYKNFTNQSRGGFPVGGRGFQNRGIRGRGISSRGTPIAYNPGQQSASTTKPVLGAFDARNKINEARTAGTTLARAAVSSPATSKNRLQCSPYKSSEPNKKEVFKAPSRPQDKLLNEIEEKEKLQRAEELKKSEEELKKAEEERIKALKEEKKKAEEELRKKVAEEAVKAAPPSKPPETPEEIAHEEEIQRKIRESLVIINPEQEIALMKEDPSQEIEMPEELRKLLKTLTTDYLCKLCSVRIVGPHMAAMHYNGKNHLKKLRNFAQTNGRSAGFNMETLDSSEKEGQSEGETGEKKTEVVEITDIDVKKYCKVCRVSFSQDSQAEMHYKGKNHAKKMKSVANGAEVFECKICCVTVTAQEHLIAHLNGARHKLQVRKLDANENYRGPPRGRGRGNWLRGQGRGDGGGRGGPVNVGDGDSRSHSNVGNRGRGLRGRGHSGDDFPWRGQGFKRRGGGLHDGSAYRDDFAGPSFNKRARF